ncbi:MAG: 4-hydroxy-tetrahydrodipicolinate reductase [Bacteroidia bacterium]|nr:4-hydroxy-tetrahydrodipicolinate reductase [Bacteroidia bacterium]
MKIALVGYGKMGKSIEIQAVKRGHEVSVILGRDDEKNHVSLTEKNIDVIIEFSHPGSVTDNLAALIGESIPVVCGTTGWMHEKEKVKKWVEERNAGFVYASNFSVGVNLLFKLNRLLAQWMNPFPQYDCFIEEQHHRFKADAPSGTALSLGEEVIQNLDRKSRLASGELQHRPPEPDELSIGFIRGGEIAGKHTVTYTSGTDEISISHYAFNREGFALGAVIAAEWIVENQKGFYNFAEIF